MAALVVALVVGKDCRDGRAPVAVVAGKTPSWSRASRTKSTDPT